jgi:TRAP-type mannitol/chloroaromatic compound transport system permease large subunit
MQWFAILIAMNLQTSFLTPPFGFSLFYLKGVAPRMRIIPIEMRIKLISLAGKLWINSSTIVSPPL